ncbi:MAG: tetratricopeptide repeat protein, partial [Candidatus Omnitrophica bacterium]|nr:tetratricopeptide repeat protein [Candidatus Omnitrophota bacterium]
MYKSRLILVAALLWVALLCHGSFISLCLAQGNTESALESLLLTRERAVNLAYSGQLKEALEMIKGIAQELPSYPKVQADYIMILAWSGEFKKAIEVYEQVTLSMQLPAYVLPDVAKCYRTLGDYPKAISLYEQSLQENPEKKEIFLGLAYSLLESQQYGRLEVELKRRLKTEPEQKRWWSILSLVYAQQSRWNDFIEAAEIVSSVQDEGPYEAEEIEQELRRGGNLYYAEIIKSARQGEYETSLEQLKKLRTIVHDDESMEIDMIIILSWNEVYEEAIKRFEQLPQGEQLPDYLWKAMAPAYRAVGEFDKATAIYSQLLMQDPKNQEILLVLLDMAMQQENSSEAYQYVLQLLEKDPENIDYQLKRLDLLWRLDRAEEAIRLIVDSPQLQQNAEAILLLEKSIDSIPEEEKKRIVSEMHQKDPAQGYSAFEVIMLFKQSETEAISESELESMASGLLVRTSEYPEFLILDIADFLFAREKYQPALKAYREVLQVSPQQPRALLGVARGLFHDGENDLALEHLELILANHPRDQQALFLKGEILESKKEYVKALQVYDTLQEFDTQLQAAQNVEVRALLEMGAYSLAVDEINSAKTDIDAELKRKAQGDLPKYQFLWNEAEQAQHSLNLNLERYEQELKSQYSQDQTSVEVEPIEEIAPDEESQRKALIEKTLNYVGDIIDDYGLKDFQEGTGSHYLRSLWDHILTLRLEKRMEELIQIYERVVEMKLSTPFWVREAAGDAYLYLQKPYKALELYQTVLEEQPKGHNIRMAVYHTHVELGRFDDAERVIDELDQDTPVQVWERGLYRENWKKVEIAFNKAWLLMYQDRLEEAQEYIDQMMQKAPSNTNFRTAMAHLHLWRGWPRLALEDFKIIRTLNPKLM